MAFMSSFWVCTRADWLLLQPEVEGGSCSELVDSRLYANELLGGERLWELELWKKNLVKAKGGEPEKPHQGTFLVFFFFFYNYLLLLSVVSSIMPESLPLDELWELRVDSRPCASLSLSPESFPLETPSMSSELGPLRPPDEDPDPDPLLGDDPPPDSPPRCWLETSLSCWPRPPPFTELNCFGSASWQSFFSSALATRPWVLLLGIGLGLS